MSVIKTISIGTKILENESGIKSPVPYQILFIELENKIVFFALEQNPELGRSGVRILSITISVMKSLAMLCWRASISTSKIK